MSRILAIANQKGGVGKTTTAVNLACGWARAIRKQRRVLLIDLDPQANATAVLLGVPVAAGPRQEGIPTIIEVLTGEAPAAEAIHVVELSAIHSTTMKARAVKMDILPAHLELAFVEPWLHTQIRGEARLRKALTDMVDQYDAILIDCPPSLGALTYNALVLAEEVIVPVDPGVFPLIGLGMLETTIEQAREVNGKLHISGVLPTMTDRTVMSRETIEEMREIYSDLLLPPVPRRVVIGEANASMSDIFTHSPDSDGAKAYSRVLKQLI